MRSRMLVVALLLAAAIGVVDGAAPVGAVAVDAALGSGAVPVSAPEVTAPEVTAPAPAPRASVRTAARRSAPVLVAGTPCLSSARACVDLSGNRAWLLRDGGIAYGPVPITHGRRGHRTPPGTFAVTFRNRDHVSSIYDAPMPYSVFFNGGIAFHQGSLRELSHGCIHLSRDAARQFFDSLSRGDAVQVVA